MFCVFVKRFKQDPRGLASKIDTTVTFPLQLHMLPYTNRARGQDTKNNFELARSCTYDLQSVCGSCWEFGDWSLCILLSRRKPMVQVQ
ncbi:hypothetical protein DID88_002481 [Monilinia fructigena]|uniref:Uncharacterized protein n=1 Tax=Monilinia fructigena TaxID=38457 RepID=A0A395INX8_9HELO|nr:hypothetical protein DID88_002481 [Monilinia fructigena]